MRRQVVTGEPEVSITQLVDEDAFLVLASDGLWDRMTNQEVVDFVAERLKKKQPLRAIIEDILDHCIADDPRQTGGIGGDNMTCIVAKLPY